MGVPGGAEAAIHALRRYADDLPKDHIIVKLDFTNAFNTLCRDEMLDAIWKELPEIYNFVHATYNRSTQLQFGEFTISSEEGPQQGDNLRSSEFYTTIQPMLIRSLSEIKVDFLDDITLAGQLDIVIKDVISIKDKTDKYGLQLNAAKCEVVYGDP